MVAACIAAGLVGGEAFSIDASLIRADVDKSKRIAGDEQVDWPASEDASRAVREYLDTLDEAREKVRSASILHSPGFSQRRRITTAWNHST